jgi:short-subunit dehydrogenase
VSNKSLSNIVITGASSGLGHALALEYAAPHRVLGLIGRNETRLQQTAEQCRRQGATVLIGLVNVAQADDIVTWINAFDDQHPIDLCIANAGISAGTGGGGESLEQIHNIFNINVNGVVNTIHPACERMKQRGYGQLAIVSSIAGFRGSPTAPAYSASKATVRIYGQALRGNVGSQGIKVNVICPGFIRTPMTDVNRFPMPFIITAEKAAKYISKSLNKNKGLIVFPWPMALMARIQNMLPDALMNKIYNSVPAKPSE